VPSVCLFLCGFYLISYLSVRPAPFTSDIHLSYLTGPCYNSSNGGTAFGTPWALNAQGTRGGPNIKWAQKRAVGKSASQLSWMSPRLIRAVSRARVRRASLFPMDLFFSFLVGAPVAKDPHEKNRQHENLQKCTIAIHLIAISPTRRCFPFLFMFSFSFPAIYHCMFSFLFFFPPPVQRFLAILSFSFLTERP